MGKDGGSTGAGGTGGTGPVKAIASSERELIARCLAGERRAHEQFFKDHHKFVAANLYRVLGHADELDDLVQEVFVIAFRGLHKFRGDARLSTWLYRICVNVALGRMRKRKRRPVVRPLSAADAERHGGTSPSPHKHLQSAQDRRWVYEILEQLSPKKRIVLFLHEIQGLELKEIAYIVGANPVTVRTRLHYARRDFYRLAAQTAEERE